MLARARTIRDGRGRSQGPQQGVTRGRGHLMTPRRREVLQLIADGWPNDEIAVHLFIALETVKSHVIAILDLLDARNRAHAAAIGVRRGIIS